jgi:hypothetical protein
MIVHDLYVVRIAIAPSKANSPLIINTNAVLPLSVPAQGLEMIAGRGTQIANFHGNIQLPQFALCDPLEGAKPSHALSLVELLSLRRAKRFDHHNSV